MAENLHQVIKPPTTKLTPYLPTGVSKEGTSTKGITTIKRPKGVARRDTSSPTGYSDDLGQPISYAPEPTYTPVYQGGFLLGFRSDTGQFIPREAAITSSGRYEPSKAATEQRTLVSYSPTGEQTLGKYYPTPTGGTLQVLESQKGTQYRVIGGKEQGTYQETPQPAMVEQPTGQFYIKQVDTFKGAPVTEVRYREQYYQTTKEGVKPTFQFYERKATPSEAEYFREQVKEEQAVAYSPETYEKYKSLITLGERAVSTYGEIKGGVQKYLAGIEQRAPTISTTNIYTAAKTSLGFTESNTMFSKEGINLFYPFKASAKVIGRIGLGVESYGEQKGIIRAKYIGATLQAGADFIPTDIAQLGGYYALGKVYKYAPKITSTAFTALGTEELLTAQSRKEQVSGALMAGAGTLGLLSEISFKKSPKRLKEISSVKEEKIAYAGKRPTRQRATVILEDTSGKQLYELDVSSNKFILPGGNIKVGETALQAAQRELTEETGLKDIGLKQIDIIKGSRETNIVFKGVVQDLDLLKLKAQKKEVTKFGFLTPKKYSGATGKMPFGEKASIFDIFKERVRADDLYVGSRARYIEKFEKLSSEKKLKIVTKYKPKLIRQFGEKEIANLSTENLAKEAFLFKKGMTLRNLITNPVEQTFIRKGKPTFLTQRAKPFDIKRASTYLDKLFGRKPGTFVKFQREPAGRLTLGSRYDIPFRELAKYKSKDLIYTSAAGKPIKLGSEKLGIKEFEVLKSKSKRGGEGLYFSPPTTASPLTSERYIPISYFKIEPGKGYDLGITFGKPKPTLYELKGEAGLSQTIKGMLGKEFEKAAKPGTVFRVVEKRKGFKIAGYGVKRFGIENVPTRGLTEADIQAGLATLETMSSKERANFLREIKIQTGRDYSKEGKRYVNPYQAIAKLSVSEEKTMQPRKERLNYYPDLRYTRRTDILPSISKTSARREPRYFGGYAPISAKEPSRIILKEPKIIPEPSRVRASLKYKEPVIPTYKEPPTRMIPLPAKVRLPQREKPIVRTTRAYSLSIKRRGKYIPIAIGLPKGKALRLLQTKLTTNIARTGKIVETGLTEESDISFKPSERIFRTYKIRGKKRFEQPDTFIQRTEANLKNPMEIAMLQDAKRLRAMSSYIG